jgi:hypothetical protein
VIYRSLDEAPAHLLIALAAVEFLKLASYRGGDGGGALFLKKKITIKT